MKTRTTIHIALALLAAGLFTSALRAADSASAPVAPPEAATPTQRRAVLIGVSEYPAPKALSGPVNDIERFGKTLETKFGFRKEDITRLVNKDATTANIIDTIKRELIEKLGPRDVAAIYFSGHGSSVIDLDGDEDDMSDEALCTYNIDGLDPKTWLTDDVIDQILRSFKTRNVLVAFDCCHSGTGTRAGEDGGSVPLPPGVVERFMSLDFAPGNTPAAPKGPVMASKGIADHMLLAACRSSESAVEAMFKDTGGEAAGGAFTRVLCDALEHAVANASFADLQAKVVPLVGDTVSQLSQKKSIQTPQFEGTFLAANITDFFAGKASPASPAPPSEQAANPPGAGSAAAPAAASAPEPARVDPNSIVPGWKPSGTINVRIATDKQRYVEGDVMTVTAMADQDCHLRLYVFSAERKVTQIFPNKFQKDHLIKAGQKVVIGGVTAEFDFVMTGPFGNELIKAVASKRPFTDEEGVRYGEEIFQQFADTNVQQLSTRGVDPAAKEAPHEFGEAITLYNVRAKQGE